MSQNKQLRRWAFTLHNNETLDIENRLEDHVKNLSEILDKIASKWIYQLERGVESEKLHFQGRMSFKVAKRQSEVIKLFNDPYNKIHVRIEHDEDKSTFYCMKKDETFVSGPWSTETKPLYIPRQVREVTELHPWQKSIIDLAKIWDTRVINIIIDMKGNIGKSTLCTYMGVNRIAKLLPFCNDYKDVLRMAYDVGVQQAYLIDMPRAINKDRLYQFFAAIETIKSGYCYDDRYKFQDRYFDCPNIFVFTNVVPDLELLSPDRWRMWKINDKLELNPCLGDF